MANFKSVVLFLKIISLFIVQRNFGNIAKILQSTFSKDFYVSTDDNSTMNSQELISNGEN